MGSTSRSLRRTAVCVRPVARRICTGIQWTYANCAPRSALHRLAVLLGSLRGIASCILLWFHRSSLDKQISKKGRERCNIIVANSFYIRMLFNYGQY